MICDIKNKFLLSFSMSESLPTPPDSETSNNNKNFESESGIKEDTSTLQDNSNSNYISQNDADTANEMHENTNESAMVAPDQSVQVTDQLQSSIDNNEIHSTNQTQTTEPVNEETPQSNDAFSTQNIHSPQSNIVEAIIASPHQQPASSTDEVSHHQKDSYQIAFCINEVSIEPTKSISKQVDSEPLQSSSILTGAEITAQPNSSPGNSTQNLQSDSTIGNDKSSDLNPPTSSHEQASHFSPDNPSIQEQNHGHPINIENTTQLSSAIKAQQPIQNYETSSVSHQVKNESPSISELHPIEPSTPSKATAPNSSEIPLPDNSISSVGHSLIESHQLELIQHQVATPPQAALVQPPIVSSPPPLATYPPQTMSSPPPVVSSPPIMPSSSQSKIPSSPPIVSSPPINITSTPPVVSSPPSSSHGPVVVKHSINKTSSIAPVSEVVQTRRYVSTTPPHQGNQHFIQQIPQPNQSIPDSSQVIQQQPPPLSQQPFAQQQQPPLSQHTYAQQPPLSQQQPFAQQQQPLSQQTLLSQQQTISQQQPQISQQSFTQQPPLVQQPPMAQQSYPQQPPMAQQLHQACISPSPMQMQQMQPLQAMQTMQPMHAMHQMQPYQMQQMQPPLHPQHLHQMKQMHQIQQIQPLQQIQSPPQQQQQQIHQMQQMQMQQMQQMQPLQQQQQQQHVQNMQQMQHMQQINQMNQINQINSMTQINQMNQMAQMNQMNQMNQLNQKNQKPSINQPNQYNQMNQMGQINQIDPLQNYKPQKPIITPSAPYPALPSSQQVQDALKEVEDQLDAQKAELNHLEHVQQRGILKLADYRNRPPQLRVQYYKGFIVPHEMVSIVKKQSQSRATASQSMYVLSNEQNGVTLKHVTDLPYLRDQITRNEDVAEPMMLTLKNWKLCALEKARLLTRQYVEKHALWEQLNGTLNRYNHESRKIIDLWPPEFKNTFLKNSLPESTLLHCCANDEPMYLDEMEKHEYVFYDMNRFVEDPVAEHLAYKRRLVWTDAEIKIFLERYAQHPREFKRIAASLPSKCVKDVIEFYDIHRIDLNLKDIEVASRKKGQRKKMVSEGSVRK